MLWRPGRPFAMLALSRRRFLQGAAALAPLATRGAHAGVYARVRPARWDDFPARLQRRLGVLGVSGWDAWTAVQRRDTERRVQEGLWDHLVAVALQSNRWTSRVRLEPALVAETFARTGRLPPNAHARLDAFAGALARRDATLAPVLVLAPPARTPAELRAPLQAACERMLRFLHEKEFVRRTAGEVAALYQARGLSTDTALEAGYALAEGAGAMPVAGPVRRVLLVGPGLELGPRTGLDDDTLGQCYQPFAVLDALRVLDRAAADIRLTALDVNPAVLDTLSERVRAARAESVVLQTALSARTHSLLPDYLAYLEDWGRGLGGAPSPARQQSSGQWRREVRLPGTAWHPIAVMAGHVALDVAPGPFDLIVATNVFAYLSDAALAAAMGTLACALLPGGVLLHNESRDLVSLAGTDAGMPVVQVRTVPFTREAAGAPMVYDRVWVHRRAVG